MDIVAAEMRRVLRPLDKACSHQAPFAFMYLRVTTGVNDVRFDDPAYLTHLDAVFAGSYFDAARAWKKGRKASVPKAWQMAFGSADGRRVRGLGDLLLGMNAHISRDLPFALAEVGLTNSKGQSVRRDFKYVNSLLGEVQTPMVKAAARRYDPSIDDMTTITLGLVSRPVLWFIEQWRNTAWADAERLVNASPGAERRAVEQDIEKKAASIASVIRWAFAYPPLSRASRSREGYCEDRLSQ